MINAGVTSGAGMGSNQESCSWISSHWKDDIQVKTKGEKANLANAGWEGERWGREREGEVCANALRQEEAYELEQGPE